MIFVYIFFFFSAKCLEYRKNKGKKFAYSKQKRLTLQAQ